MIFDRFVCIHMRVYTDMLGIWMSGIICETVLLPHFVTAGSVWKFRCVRMRDQNVQPQLMVRFIYLM